jgi:hypothetical protein
LFHRLNGYQIPEGDEKYLKEKPVSMGAEPWKEVWPNAIWPGAIPGSFPLGAWILSDVRVPLEGADKEVEFEYPHEVELFMVGIMGEDVPFFVEVEWEESWERMFLSLLKLNGKKEKWGPKPGWVFTIFLNLRED